MSEIIYHGDTCAYLVERLDNNCIGLPIPQESEPRKHHYVPRCWLAGFTASGEKCGKLWVTDLSRQKQWPSTPDKAGLIRDFYRLSIPPDPVIVEKFFSVLEDQVAPLLKTIDRERRQPDNDELDALLQFMAYQRVRVPQFRPFVLQVVDRITRERLARSLQSRETWLTTLNEAGMDTDAPSAEYEDMKRFFESGEWNLVAETDWYMQRAFRDAESILDCLRKRYWGILFTDHGRLIASDSPVVLEGEKGKMVGFKNAEYVFYPVSRHALLVGTLERVKPPIQNFNLFASQNTVTLLGADAQIYSHIPNFSWLDENRKHQTDWKKFSKDKF